MKRRLIFIFMLLGLSVTLMACTSYSRGYPYPNQGGYSGLNDVRAIANDLEEATDRLLDEAEDTRYNNDRVEYAIDRLEDLHEEAKDFEDEVDDSRGDPRDTQDDHRELITAYGRARDAMRMLYADNDVYRDFERVSRLMSELNRFYGYGRGYGGYYPGR